MTGPDPTAVRRRLILMARDLNLPLATLNGLLTDLGLAPYSTADLVGQCVCNVQTDLADPTPRPTMAQLRLMIRTQIVNSALNATQISEWRGPEVLSFDTGTGVLRVQLSLRANRTSATNAEVIALARAAVSVVPYSDLTVLPAFTGQTLTGFAFAAADPDDPV